MVNTTFLSAMLAFDVAPARYKPYPGAVVPTNGSLTQTVGQANDLFIGPQHTISLPKIKDMSDPACHVEPYYAPPIDHQDFPPYDEKIASVYRYRQQQAVNLGSWFVHESWMTPSPFLCSAGEGVSEIDIATGWGSTESARSVLEYHWDTFINASDFQWLSSIGINTVRLPIGYWNLGPDFVKDTPYAGVSDVYQNSWSRVVRAINMAGEYGIGVLVDLHGAPGSQNGQPHSGISDGAVNMFSDPRNSEKTINVLTFLARQLVRVNNVVGIQLLNDPQFVDGLTNFYSRAIDSIRQADPDAGRLPLYLHNGFDLQRFSQFIASRKDFVVQDHHSYFVYTEQDRLETATQHAQDIGTFVSDSLAAASGQTRRDLIIGEWSCALTPESMAKDPNQDQARKDFCGGQVDCYASRTSGWSFWSYVKEDCGQDPGWCFKSAVGSVLPSTFFSYGQKNPSRNSVNQIPSLALNDEQLPVIKRRRCTSPLLKRFEAISDKRARDEGQSWTTPDVRGYNDGKLTAQIFAAQSMSKLGFVNQYISDTISNLGPGVIPPESESIYTEGFLRGLSEGEAAVSGGFH